MDNSVLWRKCRQRSDDSEYDAYMENPWTKLRWWKVEYLLSRHCEQTVCCRPHGFSMPSPGWHWRQHSPVLVYLPDLQVWAWALGSIIAACKRGNGDRDMRTDTHQNTQKTMVATDKRREKYINRRLGAVQKTGSGSSPWLSHLELPPRASRFNTLKAWQVLTGEHAASGCCRLTL